MSVGVIKPVAINRRIDAFKTEFAPNDRSIGRVLERRRDAFGEKPFLVIGDVDYSVDDIIRRAGEAAHRLRAVGIVENDRVVIISANRIEFFDLFLGCCWLGAISVPVNTAARGPQLAHILRNSGAKLVAVDEDYLDAFAVISRDDTAVETVWRIGGAGDVAIGDWPIQAMPVSKGHLDPVAIRPKDVASILYTSGTTGPSKGVCLPHGQYFWWGAHSCDLLEVVADDVLMTTLPLFHINALNSFFAALLAAATVVFEPRFSASGFTSSLIRHRATVTFLLGAMVPILLSRGGGTGCWAAVGTAGAGAGRPGQVPRTVSGPLRFPPARRLWIDRNQFCHRRLLQRPAAGRHGAHKTRLPRQRRR